MSLFGSLFGKKKKNYFASKVLASRPRLDQLLAEGIQRDEYIVVCFFDESLRRIAGLLPDTHTERVVLAEKVSGGFVIPRIHTFLREPGRQIVFGERHPLGAHEEKTAERLSQECIPLPVLVYSSLDDAFFKAFGGDRIKGLMETLGLKEDEFIEHTMIEKSIENAQEKIAKKVSVESHARSDKEWFTMNVPSAS